MANCPTSARRASVGLHVHAEFQVAFDRHHARLVDHRVGRQQRQGKILQLGDVCPVGRYRLGSLPLSQVGESGLPSPLPLSGGRGELPAAHLEIDRQADLAAAGLVQKHVPAPHASPAGSGCVNSLTLTPPGRGS